MTNIQIKKISYPSPRYFKTIKDFYHGLQVGENEFENLRDTSDEQIELMFAEYIKTSQEDSTYEYYLALVDNEPAGFIEFAEESEIENTYKKYLRINSLYIDPKYRRKGIGQLLLEKAKSRAQEQGYEYIGLGALAKNQPANNLYQKFGFETYGIEYMLKAE